MYLSTSQTRALSEVIRLLAQADDSDTLRAELALPMLDLLNADTYVSFTWNNEQQRFDRVKALNMSLDNLRAWDDYYRLALLHKPESGRIDPNPGRSYAMAATGTVVGRPSCVKRLSTATRTCNSTT